MDIEKLILLKEEDYFNKFIEECETNIIAAPENFTSSVMLKINANIANIANVKAIPFISRKMAAAVCFCSAAVIMALTLSGMNVKIFDFISTAATPDKLQKLGEFINQISFGFDIFSKLNLN